jgi:recombination protein RecA
MASDKVKDLLHEINKKHGDGAVKLGNDSGIGKIDIIASTGSIKLDQALGCNGTPRGRMIEYFGNPSGGKTTLALISAIEIQKAGGQVAFIDVENSFSRDWFEALGGNMETLIFCQPSSGNECLDIVETMVKSNEVDFIIIDSSTALATTAELESEMGDSMMGQLARLMSIGCKKINSYLGNSKATVAWISQMRQKIGSYGNPNEAASGGLALKFYCSIRYDVSRGEVIGDKENPKGFITKIKLVKNKCGIPHRKIETELYIGPSKFGIDKQAEIVDLAIINGIISKSGSWFKYNYKGKEERWQGRDNLIEILKQNIEMYNEIFIQVQKTVLVRDAPVIGSFADITNKLTEEQEQEEKPKKKRGKKEEIVESEEIHIDENIISKEVVEEIKEN